MKKIFIISVLMFFVSGSLFSQWISNSSSLYNLSQNVGIGTSSPEAPLHITRTVYKTQPNNNTYISAILGSGDTHFTLFGGVTGGRIRGANAGYLVLDGNPNGTGDRNVYINLQNNSDIIMACGGGKVGIGTYSPEQRLHVNGNSYISGNVGIGTKSPVQKLDIQGNINLSALTGVNSDLKLFFNKKAALVYFNTENTNTLHINRNWTTEKGFYNDFNNVVMYGNVGIGLESPGVALDVNGTIRAHELKICLNKGCDFVFEPDYALMPLEELGSFVKQNKHLPEVAPAAVMESEGINVSEMNAMLLQKIEELTLYMISQNEKIAAMDNKINQLENRK